MAQARHRTRQQSAQDPDAEAPAERLPVTELLFDRAGAPAPFGDDQPLPLPVSSLLYRHPTVAG